MSEIGDSFRAVYSDSKLKRASNRESSASILSKAGIKFETRNGGAHLIVSHDGLVFDFWPGTGKFCLRGTAVYQRGVFRLLGILRGKE